MSCEVQVWRNFTHHRTKGLECEQLLCEQIKTFLDLIAYLCHDPRYTLGLKGHRRHRKSLQKTLSMHNIHYRNIRRIKTTFYIKRIYKMERKSI